MKVSIVIPNYNGKHLLEKNLSQVIDAAGNDIEIIVVDDASTDGSVMYLRQNFPQVKLIQHDTNLRFGAACNTGVKAAKGDLVILLNSDVIPTKGFLKPLISHFKNELVFSVGCKEIEQINGKEIVSGRTEGRFERGLFVHWRPIDQISQDTEWTIGGSMAVDRRKYLQLGGFDDLYLPGYWEDIDLSFRAKQKGFKVFFEKDSVVYHNHETTNKSVFGARKMQIMSFRNQILFVWKNMKDEQLKEHYKWLPYHLVVTSIKSRGLFFVGFIEAVARWLSYKMSN